ncbi:MAG: IscA/HesB family protein [Desulfovibrionaceae bacterium]|nr:IscA/HesB family protein [Desulfovibrionaceae bacterium]
MIDLSESARKELTDFFASNPSTERKIRIYTANGCGGPRLNMALDNPTENDAVEDLGDFAFCIDKSLLEEVKSVKIDLSYMGFILEPEIPLPIPEGAAGGSCCPGCAGCH